MTYNPNNIFAQILRGAAPCIRVYEDEETLAFMDIMPEAEGHVPVIPKEHAETLLDLSEAGARACIETIRTVAIAAKRTLGKPDRSIATKLAIAQFPRRILADRLKDADNAQVFTPLTTSTPRPSTAPAYLTNIKNLAQG